MDDIAHHVARTIERHLSLGQYALLADGDSVAAGLRMAELGANEPESLFIALVEEFAEAYSVELDGPVVAPRVTGQMRLGPFILEVLRQLDRLGIP